MHPRPINKEEEINEVIGKCQVCHIAMVDDDHHPYLLPMNFGYREGIVYLHSAQEGKKMSILRKHAAVCVAFSTDYQLRYQNEEVACSWGMKYRSILIYGHIEFIEDLEGKTDAMNVIMRNYAGRDFPYGMPAITGVCVYKVVPDRVDGRAYGY